MHVRAPNQVEDEMKPGHVSNAEFGYKEESSSRRKVSRRKRTDAMRKLHICAFALSSFVLNDGTQNKQTHPTNKEIENSFFVSIFIQSGHFLCLDLLLFFRL